MGTTGELYHTPNLLSSAGYLHDLGIIHRDVKVQCFFLCLKWGLRSSSRSKKAAGEGAEKS